MDVTEESAGTAGAETDEAPDQSEAGAVETGSEPVAAGLGSGRSKRGVFWILAGLVATGVAAGYNWWKGLPKD